ncbi:MAG: alpha-amylase family glycosyl hydrolase [Candidatus Marinimicrobia bacterium]|nr:alpha-amylase family glycosyl hydrolase [Candidatus Neomarinimicrobiota bacterium]
MKRLSLFIFILLLLIGCSVNPVPQLDIIPVQFVFSGDVTGIAVQDLFYADDYSSLSFRSHPHLEVSITDNKNELTIQADREFSGYTTLTFMFNNNKYELPVQVIERKYITFTYIPDWEVEKVCVFGNFNFWLRDRLWMTKDNDGNFSITIPFEPGQYEYLFAVDGKEILDPSNPNSVPNGLGGFNSPLRVLPDFSGIRPFLTPESFKEENDLCLKFHVLKNDYIGDISHYDMVAMIDNHRISASRIKVSDGVVSLRVSKKMAQTSRRIRFAWTSDITTSNLTEIILENGLPAGNEGDFKWQDAIMYSLMVDRFYNGNPGNDDPILHAKLADRVNFHGGDLQGLIYKLDEGYFNDLGVNTLWILPFVKNTPNPFHETPPPHRMFTGYHGYWPVSGRDVDPHYGTLDDVHTMVTVAHKRDLHLLMDYVSNHVHEEHPYYQNHPEWFGQYVLPDGRKNLRLFDEYRLTTWFESYLPSFDYPNAPEAVDTMVADAIWWIKNYNIDGFRHDAVKHVPNVFWRSLTREIRKEFPDKDIFQIGETFGDHSLIHSYVNNGQLSAQFNFNLYWPARYAFAMEDASFSSLATEMERIVDIYGQNHLMANLMDSHDQPRYPAYLEHDLDWGDDAQEIGWQKNIQIDDLTTYDKIEMYMTYLMTIPGPPVIYYGNEVGVTGGADPDNRRKMDWTWNSRQKELKKYISVMTALRSKHPALRYGDYSTIRADKQVYAYLRSDFNERILVVIFRKNLSEEIHITLPEELNVGSLECLNDSPEIQKDNLNGNTFNIQVKPYSGYVFKIIN